MSLDASRWAWEQKTGSSASKLVLLALADRADADDCCFPSLKLIQADTELDRKTIIAGLNALHDRQLIRDTGKRRGKTRNVKVYQLIGVSHRHGGQRNDDDGDDETVPKTEPLNSTENGIVNTSNSTKNGTVKQYRKRNSTENGTVPKTVLVIPGTVPKTEPLNSTENGTLVAAHSLYSFNLPVKMNLPLKIEPTTLLPEGVGEVISAQKDSFDKSQQAAHCRPPEKIRGKTKSKEGTPAKTAAVWQAYSDAYFARYEVEPVRNAMVSGMLGRVVDRLGAEAPFVAAFYVQHNSAFYVAKGHAVQFLLNDAEKLRTEWATGKMITQRQASQVDRKQTNFNVYAKLIAEARAQREAK